MWSFLGEHTLLYASVAICFCTVSYFSLGPRGRDVVVDRLRLRRRRPSSAQTPPRSLSPENLRKIPLSTPAQGAEYAGVYPPSQRDVLRDMRQSMPQEQRDALGDLAFDLTDFERSLLGWEEEYSTADNSKYVCSGLSVGEVKALGDFPDYATLSGVPLPQPCHNFDVKKAIPRPYRPFRWNYHQTMSLSKMDTDYWLELENTYVDRIRQRKELFAKHGGGVLQTLPGSELACKELMEMCLQFLCARYPSSFVLTPSPEDPNKMIFENKILGTTLVVQNHDPLIVLLETVPEDFAIMLRHPDTGYYHFRAGMICSALGWNVESKIGLRLHEIHAPVPDYKEKMQFSMDRYFSKKPANKPIQRTSWGLEVDQPLYMPPGHPHEKYRDLQAPDLTRDRIYLRTDHQTLRRLPLSGAVVFNFKALFTNIKDFKEEPYIPSLILKVCKEGKENLLKYKNIWHTEHVSLPALEEYEQYQIGKGMIEKDWDVRTLDESPFYPGWEKLWHERQGY